MYFWLNDQKPTGGRRASARLQCHGSGGVWSASDGGLCWNEHFPKKMVTEFHQIYPCVWYDDNIRPSIDVQVNFQQVQTMFFHPMVHPILENRFRPVVPVRWSRDGATPSAACCGACWPRLRRNGQVKSSQLWFGRVLTLLHVVATFLGWFPATQTATRFVNLQIKLHVNRLLGLP